MYPYNGAFMPVANMQPRLNQYQPYQGYTGPQLVKGRVVAGLDEAKAAQFDLDGTPSYFPSPAEGKIYVKHIDFNGLPVFNVYQLVENKPNQPVVYAEQNTVMALQKRVDQLESLLKGVTNNGQQLQSYANDANNGSASTKQQPDGTNAEHVWE